MANALHQQCHSSEIWLTSMGLEWESGGDGKERKTVSLVIDAS